MRSVPYFMLPLFAALAMSAAPAHGRGFSYFISHDQASGRAL
jgi:hypothetical protein